jgi:hypothetical protein
MQQLYRRYNIKEGRLRPLAALCELAKIGRRIRAAGAYSREKRLVGSPSLCQASEREREDAC